jgi:hypothetical protein
LKTVHGVTRGGALGPQMLLRTVAAKATSFRPTWAKASSSRPAPLMA